ncbi:hypothetical protein TeGR_g1601, partial [Tetraparma gracilis]
LGDLIYPLVEIILGLAKLVPSTRHIPLRLHCVRLLQQLAGSANLFIPTSSILLDMLSDKSLQKKNRGSAPAPRLPLLLALPKDDPLGSVAAQDTVVAEIFTLLNREIDLYRHTIAFPEFSLRISARLKAFGKGTFNQKWGAFASGAVELCGKHAVAAKQARAKFDGAPKDAANKLEILKPQGAPNMGDRLEASVKKEKRFEDWNSEGEIAVGEKQRAKERKEREKAEAQEREEREREERAKEKGSKKKKSQGERYIEEGADLDDDEVEDIEDEVQDLADWSDEDDDEEESE